MPYLCPSLLGFANGAGELITVSTEAGALCKMYICTDTPKYSLFDAQKNTEINRGVLELCRFYVGGTRTPGGGESIYLGEFWAVLRDIHMY